MLNKILVAISFLLICMCSAQSIYNEHQTLRIFFYSKTAYCNITEIQTWNCISCGYIPLMQNITVFYNASHHSQAYTGYDPQVNYIVVAFRGTNDIVNWMNDAKFDKVSYSYCDGCQIHKGFQETYDDISSDLIKSVKILKSAYPSASIVVTGHSLGAAVASIAAIDIQQQVAKVDFVTHFASPRAGNQQFAEYFNHLFPNAIRVVHYHDIVPHVPTQSLGYQHHANEIWYPQETMLPNTYIICDSSGEDPNCSDSVSADKYAIDDHTNYFDRYTGCDENPQLEQIFQQ